MSENTKIEWCDHTFNPWEGCQKVSPGCDNCYAEARNSRFGGGTAINWGPSAPRRRTSAANWALPKRWNAQADAFMAQHGRRQRVFCASLADVFDNSVPVQWRRDLFDMIAATPNLDWLLLTKRIGNARSLYSEAYLETARAWPDNVWIGATIVNQAEADRDIPKLLAVPTRVRFLSMEPLLGPVDLTKLMNPGPLHQRGAFINALSGGTYGEVPATGERLRITHSPIKHIDWVIVGGESGPNSRPMHPDWARSLRDQCEAAGVPFLFKQWGEWGEPDSIERSGIAHHGWFEQDRRDGGVPRHEWPGPMQNDVELTSLRPEVFRVGKKAAGRLLDGRTWDGFPS